MFRKNTGYTSKKNFAFDFIMNGMSVLKSYQTGIGFAQPNFSTQTINYFYNVKDWLGSNRVVLDQTGSPVNVTDHYPYGEKLLGRATIFSPESDRFQFKGHEYDDETGYEYHGARYYNRTLGRYMSIDPLAAQFPSHSVYNYTLGNPIMFIDPDGRAADGDYFDHITGEKLGTDNVDDGFEYTIAKEDFNKVASMSMPSNDYANYLRRDIFAGYTKGFSSTHEISSNFEAFKLGLNTGAPWINTGMKELGVTRWEGKASNPRIEEYLTYTQLEGADVNDKTAWCAGFVNYCLVSNNLDGSGSALAYSFKTYGQEIPKAAYGAIVVFNFSHVGMVAGKTADGRLVILGGNQSNPNGGENAVTLSPNGTSQITHYRFPNGYTPNFSLPILNVSESTLNYNSTR